MQIIYILGLLFCIVPSLNLLQDILRFILKKNIGGMDFAGLLREYPILYPLSCSVNSGFFFYIYYSVENKTIYDAIFMVFCMISTLYLFKCSKLFNNKIDN